MEGTNFVELTGKIVYPDFKTVGGGHKLFKAKVAIPLDESKNKFQYIKIVGWREIAEALGELPSDTYIKVHGHIEERTYDGKCRNCGRPEKKYWTEVLVDNFVVVNE